ncbi:hypothetical protein AN933_23810 [Mycobacterium intracellulare subsp. chimaera]|nr:hypothetical protein AN933_23810 [Mycobacterium intracellulare subsp. chimaera]
MPMHPYVLNRVVAEATWRRRRGCVLIWTVAAAAAVILMVGGFFFACQANLAQAPVSRQAEGTALTMTPPSAHRAHIRASRATSDGRPMPMDQVALYK